MRTSAACWHPSHNIPTLTTHLQGGLKPQPSVPEDWTDLSVPPSEAVPLVPLRHQGLAQLSSLLPLLTASGWSRVCKWIVKLSMWAAKGDQSWARCSRTFCPSGASGNGKIQSIEETILARSAFGFLTAWFKKKNKTNKQTSEKKMKKGKKK